MDKLIENLRGAAVLLIGLYIVRGVFRFLREVWREERAAPISKQERIGARVAWIAVVALLFITWVCNP